MTGGDTARLPAWLAQVGPAALLGPFEYLPGTVAFVKDAAGRYVWVNRTLCQRLRLSRDRLLGQRATEVFPAALGARYAEQDRAVLAGRDLTEHLELHLYPGGQTGWCLSTKRALYRSDGLHRTDGPHGAEGAPLGVIGVSRDVQVHAAAAPGLAAALAHLGEHHAGALSMTELARVSGLSLSAFERQVKRVYGVTPSQLLTRARLDTATRLLQQTTLPVARVAAECGYFDHSAFTRVFRSVVGLTPAQFRAVRFRES
jgi:AraC-like DNA-binding protein